MGTVLSIATGYGIEYMNCVRYWVEQIGTVLSIITGYFIEYSNWVTYWL
jgi:hypothetical protein